jgi:hypothetical protein
MKTELEKAAEKYNPLKKLDGEFIRQAFKDGAKWQAERGYSEEEVKRLAFDFYYDMSHKMGVATNLISENATNVDIWFEQFKKK